MKTAVCISGQPRFFKTGHYYLKNNLIDPNNADVFIHSWYDEDKIGEEFDSSWGKGMGTLSRNAKEEILDLYKPKKYIFEKSKNFRIEGIQQNTSASVYVTFSMIYSWCQSLKLAFEYAKENYFLWDCLVKTRFDAGILSKVDLSNHDMNKMNYSNSINNPAVICDWLNFSGPKNMWYYSLLFDNLRKYCESGVLVCGEEMITKHINDNRIEREPLPINFYLIRDEQFRDRSHFGRTH